jgi:predicted Zn-dependent protease
MLVLLLSVSSFALQAPPPASDDPVLAAMRSEMERSKAKLKLEKMAAPYYLDYRIVDVDELSADATFGALRTDVRTRYRLLRVVVRIGDYKRDSFFGPGQGITDFVAVDNDVLALRHQLWLATDRAYKAATEALTQKEAQLGELNIEHPVDDFAHAEPVQLIGPLADMRLDPQPWLKMIQQASGMYARDPKVESFDAGLRFQAANRYFINSEGTVVRSGQTLYEMSMVTSTQAADGMRLERSWAYTFTQPNELPSEKEFLDRSASLLGALKQLRDAPVVDDDYRGPVLFSGDAASSIFADFIGENVLGNKPDLGQPARTTGSFATSYKTRVLPDFLSVVDDPTLTSIEGKPLLGHYEVDDEGVKAVPVPVIEKGKLENFVVGREPIRDFPASNGHGRARPGYSPGPSLGNLVVRSSEALLPDQLKKKLIELCQQRDLAYGYYVETMGPQRTPRLLYKVWVKDGHLELVRGATFAELDTRTLRNDIVAAGSDLNVENRALNVPHSIVNPAILFDELEVKRGDTRNDKLPEYPAPAMAGTK